MFFHFQSMAVVRDLQLLGNVVWRFPQAGICLQLCLLHYFCYKCITFLKAVDDSLPCICTYTWTNVPILEKNYQNNKTKEHPK